MPQYRKLYVKSVESDDINEMPDDFTRLLWVLLPLGLDREGRGKDNPAWIKAKLMPLRTDVDDHRISAAMEWYANRGMIIRYTAEGRSYFYVPSFGKYQGDTTRETESAYPAPPKSIINNPDDTHDGYTNNSGLTHEPVMTNSCSDTDTDSNTDSEAEAEAGGAGAAAAPGLADDKTAMAVFFRVTGFTSIPSPEMARLDQLVGLIQQHGVQVAESALRSAFQTWISTKRKNGGGTYRGTNLGWVDWAMEALAKNVSGNKDPSQMTDREFVEYYQRKAEQESMT